MDTDQVNHERLAPGSTVPTNNNEKIKNEKNTDDNQTLFTHESDCFLSAEQVGKILQLPTKTVYQLIQDEMIPAVKYGRAYRILLSDLLNRHRESAGCSQGKEVFTHERPQAKRHQQLHDRLVPQGQKRQAKTIPPFDWTERDEEAGATNGT